MRMPHANMSPVTMSDTYCFYLLSRLKAVAALAYILEYFMGVRTALLTQIEKHKVAVQERRHAIALRDHENDEMNQELRVLGFTILGVANNNRSSPLFRHYFPQGFTEAVRTSVARQRQTAVMILEKLNYERDETVRTRLEPFQAQFERFDAAIAAVQAARDEEARQRSSLEGAKVDWLDGYRRTYQMLQDHYGSNPRKAESLFRTVRASSSGAEEDDEDFDLESDLGDESLNEGLELGAGDIGNTGDPDFDDTIAGVAQTRVNAMPRVAEPGPEAVQ